MDSINIPSDVLIQQQHHVFEGHTARIFSLALCTLANGNRIAASASHDRTVRIWCLTTLQHLRTLTYSDFVWRVFLVTTAVGRVCVIAFVSANDKIHVSDFETGEELYVVDGRLVFAGVVKLYNSPIIVTLINDVDIDIVDVESGTHVRYIRGGFEKAFRAVVSVGPRPVLVFNTWNAQNRRSSIQAYDLYVDPTPAERAILPDESITTTNYLNRSTWLKFRGPPRDEPYIPSNMKIVFEGDSRDGITSLVISQSAKPLICSGHYDNVIRVWDLASLQLLLLLEGHYDWVVSVTVWKGIEPLVISGSSDGTIKVWDLQTGHLIATCEGHLRDVWAVTVTTGPKPLIVSASADRTVRTWDINPVIMDMKWARRCDFAMFLAQYGLINRPSQNPLLHRKEALGGGGPECSSNDTGNEDGLNISIEKPPLASSEDTCVAELSLPMQNCGLNAVGASEAGVSSTSVVASAARPSMLAPTAASEDDYPAQDSRSTHSQAWYYGSSSHYAYDSEDEDAQRERSLHGYANSRIDNDSASSVSSASSAQETAKFFPLMRPAPLVVHLVFQQEHLLKEIASFL